MTSVAVTSRSFSTHPVLRHELCKRYPQVVFNDKGKSLSGYELIDFLKYHDMAIIGLERLDAETLVNLPYLKVVSRFGVGIDTLDLHAMQRLGIRLAYTAGANKRSVAELVIAFAINMLRLLPHAHHEVKTGSWNQRKGRQLSGKPFGIIGLGAIGKEVALLLKAFDCTILAYDVIKHAEFCNRHGIVQLDLETLLQESTIISLHLPLNKSTAGILDTKRLSLLKHDAIVINTARGGLVNEQTIKYMLLNQKLAAAAFDVFENEPPTDKELVMLPNFFATPHIGGSTEEAILAMGYAAIEGLDTAALPELA